MRLTGKLFDEFHHRLAVRIRKERVKRKLSMLAVANRAGISQHGLYYVEIEKNRPSIEVLIRICAALELDVAEILSYSFPKR